MKLIIYVKPKKIDLLFKAIKDYDYIKQIGRKDIKTFPQKKFIGILIDIDFYQILVNSNLI